MLFQDRKWCFCPLKTKNAYRSVNITESFCNYLKKLKREQDENRLLYGDGYKRNFVTDRLVRNKETLIEIDDFINVKVNGEMLGHAKLEFTLKYYTHVTEKMSEMAKKALETTVTFDEFCA